MQLADLFADTTGRYGLPAGFLQRTAQIESSMNPNARNPRSSAGGLFQFIDSTARNYGLSNKFDPAAATDAAARLARDNAGLLRRALGRDPNGAELYLAHQQGGGGAAKLLANPTAPAASIVGDAAIRLNGGAPGMTALEFANKWINKFNMTPGQRLPMMAQAGAPQPVTPGAQMAPPAVAASPEAVRAAVAPSLASMFAMDERAKQREADEQAAEQTRRAALFGGLTPFG